MDFEVFIDSLMIISKRLFKNDSVECYFNFFENYLTKLILNKTNKEVQDHIMNEKFRFLKNETMIIFIKDIEEISKSLFEYYSSSNKMEYNSFIKFYKDILVFPDKISKKNIDFIYFKLNDDIEKEIRLNLQKKFQTNKNKIFFNLNCFAKSLIVVSSLMNFQNNYNDFEKILIILEEINLSYDNIKIGSEKNHFLAHNITNERNKFQEKLKNFIVKHKEKFNLFLSKFNNTTNKTINSFDLINFKN